MVVVEGFSAVIHLGGRDRALGGVKSYCKFGMRRHFQTLASLLLLAAPAGGNPCHYDNSKKKEVCTGGSLSTDKVHHKKSHAVSTLLTSKTLPVPKTTLSSPATQQDAPQDLEALASQLAAAETVKELAVSSKDFDAAARAKATVERLRGTIDGEKKRQAEAGLKKAAAAKRVESSRHRTWSQWPQINSNTQRL